MYRFYARDKFNITIGDLKIFIINCLLIIIYFKWKLKQINSRPPAKNSCPPAKNSRPFFLIEFVVFSF